MAPVLGNGGKGEGQGRTEGEPSLSSFSSSPVSPWANQLPALLLPPTVSKGSEQAPRAAGSVALGKSAPLGSNRLSVVWRRQGWDKARWWDGEEAIPPVLAPCLAVPSVPWPQQRSLNGPGVSKACTNVKQKLKGERIEKYQNV